MLLSGKWAVTRSNRGVVADPVIEVEKNRITSVSSQPGAKGDLHVDGIVAPGFISTHTHLHGLVAYGHPVPSPAGFWPFLKEWWWPFIEDALTGEDVAALATYGSVLHLKNGYTCFCDIMEAPNAVPGVMIAEVEAIKPTGARALVSLEATERCDRNAAEAMLAENEGILELKGRVKGIMSVHTTFSCGSSYFQRAKEIARKHDSLFQFHLSEGAYHVEDTLKRFGKRPVPYLEELGVLDEKCLASQCVHLRPEEVEILARRGVSVSHNPISNMEIGTGVAPVAEMVKQQVTVSLGDDGFIAAYDPFHNLRATFTIHALQTPGQVSVADVLGFHTDRAGEALHLEVGRLEEGYLADIIMLEDNAPSPLNATNVESHLVLGASARDIAYVLSDGQLVVERGRYLPLEEEQARSRAYAAIRCLWAKATRRSAHE